MDPKPLEIIRRKYHQMGIMEKYPIWSFLTSIFLTTSFEHGLFLTLNPKGIIFSVGYRRG